MFKKLIFLIIAATSLSFAVTYAQTTSLRIAQDQVKSSTEFANQQLTAKNANRYADLQNQVGTTIETQKRIVDESKRNVDQTLIKLDQATTFYTSFNSRFLH